VIEQHLEYNHHMLVCLEEMCVVDAVISPRRGVKSLFIPDGL
jgi:hypothetical protein